MRMDGLLALGVAGLVVVSLVPLTVTATTVTDTIQSEAATVTPPVAGPDLHQGIERTWTPRQSLGLPENVSCPLPSPSDIAKNTTNVTTSPSNGSLTELDRSLMPPESGAIPDIGRLNNSVTGNRVNGVPIGAVEALFSRDNDSRFITDQEFVDRYGWNRSGRATVANGSDVTTKRPPSMARTWTWFDFGDLRDRFERVSDWNTSVYPVGTNTTMGRLDAPGPDRDRTLPVIEDAHATIYAAQPSTYAHLSDEETVLYLAPNGSLLGLVDYRVQVPSNRSLPPAANASAPNDSPPNGSVPAGTGRVLWCLERATVTDVRLLQGDTVLARTGPNDTNQTPAMNYSLTARSETTLRLEAEINASFRRRVDRYRCENATPSTGGNHSNGTRSCRWRKNTTAVHSTTVTVTDELEGRVYDLQVSLTTASYPGGDEGIAVFKPVPWQGFTFSADDEDRVRGVWRFYTARSTSWDVLEVANGTTRAREVSPAVPVYVHAFPSRLGPMVENRAGPQILQWWGERRATPSGTLGEYITVEAIPDRYNAVEGLALRAGAVDRGNLTVRGIVAGVNATVTIPESGRTETLRNSTIEALIVAENRSAAVVKVTLLDNATGAPIALSKPPLDLPFRDPSGADDRQGYVVVNGHRVETNATGQARVVVEDPGVINVRYVPESWVTVDPAYQGSQTSVRWELVGGFGWLLHVLVKLVEFSLPFLVVAYAAKKFGELYAYEQL